MIVRHILVVISDVARLAAMQCEALASCGATLEGSHYREYTRVCRWKELMSGFTLSNVVRGFGLVRRDPEGSHYKK